MIIESVEISNFRVYKGHNQVNFKPSDGKNITLISANNGFGKTTFLTALTWAFYGKQIVAVEPKYRRDISNSGGYSNFLKTLVNKELQAPLGESVYVKISLSEIQNPSIPFSSATICRTVNTSNWTDEVEILIDGQESELTTNIGNDVFINDYILPREIAKFFFFDAEKIVSLAEAKSIPELRQLGIAYSEVLGISKFEELLVSLNNTLLKISKDGPDKEIPIQYEFINSAKNKIEDEINNSTKIIETTEQSIQKLEIKLNEIRESLYREGSINSKEKLRRLEESVKKNKEELNDNSRKIKEYLEYMPFIVANSLYTNFIQTVTESSLNSLDNHEIENLFTQFKELVLTRLKEESLNSDVIENEILGINVQHLSLSEKTSLSISLDNNERDYVLSTHHFIEKHVKSEISDLFNKDSMLRQSIYSNNAILKNSETNKLNPIVEQLHSSREQIQLEISQKQALVKENTEKLGALRTNLNSTLRVHSQLFKKLSTNATDYKKIEILTKTIQKIKALIEELHSRKKQNLEFAILTGINRLMHKEGFVSKVELSTSNGIFNVNLYDENGLMIEKNDLSKGEQQLYATALLTALVEESGIKFPVFIDSPLQKFDKSHTLNVITQFYPKISKQVVLFPLLEKELTLSEFESMSPFVNSAFRVENTKGASKIKEIKLNQLFSN